MQIYNWCLHSNYIMLIFCRHCVHPNVSLYWVLCEYLLNGSSFFSRVAFFHQKKVRHDSQKIQIIEIVSEIQWR